MNFVSYPSSKKKVFSELEHPRSTLSYVEDVKDPESIDSLKSFGQICEERRSRDCTFKCLLNLEHCSLRFPKRI